MILESGRELGPYRILGKVGEGGMGAVYRALDVRLEREVAIKVLPEDVIQNPERVQRFQREARLLAALNHHGIASIYDIENLADRPCLVLELVPGQDLAELSQQGPMETLRALRLFHQAAEALAAAHQADILHRDLKPGNMMVTPDGRLKILDFGLAKTIGTQLSTKAHLETQEGAVLGTASYLAPEQLQGESLDARSDVWGLGCCLFEVLTGKQAFAGKTLGATLTSVLTTEPDWEALPQNDVLRALIKDCLEKNPQERLSSMTEFAERLDPLLLPVESKAMSRAPTPVSRTKLQAKPLVPAPARWSRPTAVVAGVLALALAVGLGSWLGSQGTPASAPQQILSVTVPEGTVLPDEHPALALSEDGKLLVYPALSDGLQALYLRHLNEPEVRRINGTEGGVFPFLSPSGKRLGYFREDGLFWLPTLGGAPTQMARRIPREQFLGATWVDEDRVVFATTAGGLQSVSAQGGEVTSLLVPDPTSEDRVFAWPACTAEAGAVIFSVRSGGTYAQGRVESLDLATGKRTVLERQAYAGRRSSAGGLLYLRRGALMLNQEVVLTKVWAEESRGESAFASAPGLIVAVTPAGQNAPFPRWIDREGNILSDVDALPSSEVRLSPDGRGIAFRKFSDEGREIWLKDVSSARERRLTNDSNAVDFVFHPDSKKLAFGSDREGPFNIYTTDIDSGETPLRLTHSPYRQFPKCWTHDVLIYEEERPGQGHDIVALPNTGGKPYDIVATRFDEREPALSPDGKWLAYQSDQSGTPRLYLKEFPNGLSRILTTGTEPAWTNQGRLIFRQGDDMMEIENLENPVPVTLFTHNFSRAGRRFWDMTLDGEKFLVLERSASRQEGEIWVVLNFPEL